MERITCPFCGRSTIPSGKGRHKFGACECGAGYSGFVYGEKRLIDWKKEVHHV